MSEWLFSFERLTWLGALALALDIAALTSIWHSHKHARKAKLIWTTMVALMPVLGAIAWFALGREPRPAR